MRLFLILLFLTGFNPHAAWAAIKGKDLLTNTVTEIPDGPKGTVVVFLSAKCPCSASHVAELRSLKKAYPAFQFIGVHANRDEGADETKAYIKRIDLPFPILRDSDLALADRFKANKTPHAFVLNLKGEILYRGGVSDSKDCAKADRLFLREALDDLTHDRNVRTPEARTLGCSIVRGAGHAW